LVERKSEEMEWEKKCMQKEGEIARYQERVSRLLRDCFFDYESHTKDTPLGEQITLLERHLQKLKEKNLKTDAKKNRSPDRIDRICTRRPS